MLTKDFVSVYHSLGLSQKEILQYLAFINGIIVSERTLKRILRSMGLFRRKYYSDILDVALFLEQEIEQSGQLHGYKFLHLKCIQNGFVVTQESVRCLLHIIDPKGIERRRKGRLQRRLYYNPGPDFMWHLDSYDKLKPYGICINGAIDGFSRFIIWLEAYTTSSDPAIIASYFIASVKSRKGCPKRVRSDMGTENGYVANMQKFFRYEHRDGLARNSFLYGSSNHNQRIEAWWCFLRRHNAQYWMDIFQRLKDEDLFTGDFLDKNLIQFCFMKVIQNELDNVVHLWNTHRIRPGRHRISPSGRPVTMYHIPNLYGCLHQLCPVSMDQINVCEGECTPKSSFPCDRTVFDTCCFLMSENNKIPPNNAEEAVELYTFLRQTIHREL